jgi:transposase InsO family protein
VRRRELAGWFQITFGVSCVRACRLAQFSRAAWYRPSRARDQSVLRARIREIAHVRPRFGFLRIWVMLRREGWHVNVKRVRRLYRLEGLQVRKALLTAYRAELYRVVQRARSLALAPIKPPRRLVPCRTVSEGG